MIAGGAGRVVHLDGVPAPFRRTLGQLIHLLQPGQPQLPQESKAGLGSLGPANPYRPVSLDQIAWANTRLKTSSPQALSSEG